MLFDVVDDASSAWSPRRELLARPLQLDVESRLVASTWSTSALDASISPLDDSRRRDSLVASTCRRGWWSVVDVSARPLNTSIRRASSTESESEGSSSVLIRRDERVARVLGPNQTDQEGGESRLRTCSLTTAGSTTVTDSVPRCVPADCRIDGLDVSRWSARRACVSPAPLAPSNQ